MRYCTNLYLSLRLRAWALSNRLPRYRLSIHLQCTLLVRFQADKPTEWCQIINWMIHNDVQQIGTLLQAY